MLISSHTNLIPYEQRRYPLQPFGAEDMTVVRRRSIARHNRFQQPPAADTIQRRHYGERYDRTHCLHYCEDYQKGRRVDIYA